MVPTHTTAPVPTAWEGLPECASAAPGPITTRGVLQSLPLSQLKSLLLDTVYGSARGVGASIELRAQAEELVSALETTKPCPAATDAVDVLHGRWRLVYTSNAGTLSLLSALAALPLVNIGDVYQNVDGKTLTAENCIDLALPVMVSLRANTGMEVRTPNTCKVRFHSVGIDTFIQTPTLASNLNLPDSIKVFGSTIDFTPIKQLIVAPVDSGLSFATEAMRYVVAPRVSLPSVEQGSLFMLTTYLDDTLRISRDDNGGVFVMLREA